MQYPLVQSPLVGMTLVHFFIPISFLGLVDLYVNVACAGSCSPIPPLLWMILASPGHLSEFQFLGRSWSLLKNSHPPVIFLPKMFRHADIPHDLRCLQVELQKLILIPRNPKKTETPDKGVDRKAPCVPTQAKSTNPEKNQIICFH